MLVIMTPMWERDGCIPGAVGFTPGVLLDLGRDTRAAGNEWQVD